MLKTNQLRNITQWNRARWLFSVLCCLLIAALIPSGITRAQSGTQVVVSPATSNINIGETTSVRISVVAGVDINAFDITVTYDPTIVSLESWSTGSYLTNLAMVKTTNGSGSLRLVYTQLATAGANGDGTLIQLAFKGLTGGTSPVTIQSRLSNTSAESVPNSTQNGVINIAPVLVDTATFTFTPTQKHTSTFTSTPTFTATPTFTTTPTFTATRTPTRTVISASKVPSNTPTATKTPVVTQAAGLTLAPTSLSSTNEPTTISASSTPETLSGTETPVSTATEPAAITQTGGHGSLWEQFLSLISSWQNQLPCCLSLLLLLILIVLVVVILRRRNKKNSSEE